MKTRLALSTAALLGLAAVLPSQAAVIGDFEGGSMDGWTADDPGFVFTPGTFGVTLGSSSLQTVAPGGWHKSAKLDLKAMGLVPLIQAGSAVSLDLTIRNDNNQIPDWWKGTSIVLNSELGGWKDLGEIQKPVTWSPTTYNLSWTIPADQAAIIQGSPGQGWIEFFLINNCGSQGATYWIDNIQVNAVPEPASAALLGLGLAGMLALRRRNG